jgi:hypothetical protein
VETAATTLRTRPCPHPRRRCAPPRHGRRGESGDHDLSLTPEFSYGSCWSQYEFAGYHKKSSHKPSAYLIANLRKHEARQKRCAPTRPRTKKRSDSSRPARASPMPTTSATTAATSSTSAIAALTTGCWPSRRPSSTPHAHRPRPPHRWRQGCR